MSAVVALMSISLRVNQIVTGLGVVLFGIGSSSYIGRSGDPPLHGQSASATITPFFDDGPADWPVVGPILFGHDFVVYVTWIFAALASWYLFKTRTGLATRAVGEDPASADAAGVRVAAVRYAHVLVGGAAAGFGGTYFTLALIPSWQDEITAGAGWIAIAIVIIARWRPWRALLAAYVFGAATRLGLTLQILNVSVSPQILSMIPFLLAIAAVLLSSITRSRGSSAPASAGAAVLPGGAMTLVENTDAARGAALRVVPAVLAPGRLLVGAGRRADERPPARSRGRARAARRGGPRLLRPVRPPRYAVVTRLRRQRPAAVRLPRMGVRLLRGLYGDPLREGWAHPGQGPAAPLPARRNGAESCGSAWRTNLASACRSSSTSTTRRSGCSRWRRTTGAVRRRAASRTSSTSRTSRGCTKDCSAPRSSRGSPP